MVSDRAARRLLVGAAAELRLGRINPAAVPAIALRCVELGLASDRMIDLALATAVDAELGRVPRLLEIAAAEHDLRLPEDEREAAEALVRIALLDLFDHRIGPAEAESLLARDYTDRGTSGTGSLDLAAFIGQYWARDELIDTTDAGPDLEQLLRDLDAETLTLAREWLDRYGADGL